MQRSDFTVHHTPLHFIDLLILTAFQECRLQLRLLLALHDHCCAAVRGRRRLLHPWL